METITNHVPRFTVDSHELTATERAEFDYLDWSAIDEGNDSATFFRYRGTLYDLGEFMRTDLPGWDGIATDSFFSVTVVKLVDDGEAVIVGKVYA